MTQRRRDITIILAGVAILLTVLALATNLKVLDAAVAWVVLLCASIVYFSQDTRVENGAPDGLANDDQGASDAQGFLDALPMPAIQIDKKRRVVAFNSAADLLLRIGGKVLPKESAVIRHPGLLSVLDQVRVDGRARTIDIDLGPRIPQTWRASVSGFLYPSALLVVFEDLTSVMSAEKARSDFLANASHELRTPLTSISGYIETMQGPAKDDKESWDRFLTIMQGEAERMKRLIADLMSLSRIEFSEHQKPDDQINFSDLIHRGRELIQPLAQDRGITLSVSGPSEALPIIGDNDEVVQVIDNLLSNAVKYTPIDGNVHLTFGRSATMTEVRECVANAWNDSDHLTILQAPPEGRNNRGTVWMRIEDSGPGISSQHLPRLGERFYRAEQSRGGKISGTGLGLAIVKHIMTRHRGGLSVESRIGQGTAFAVWFPQAPEPIAETDI